jgi:hypothetical protein
MFKLGPFKTKIFIGTEMLGVAWLFVESFLIAPDQPTETCKGNPA